MTGELTLKHPLTKEDWDIISDAELERTKRIWFETPSGKRVEFIPMSVIDDIKAEIDSHCSDNRDRNDGLYIAMKIIDKYKENMLDA